MVIVGLGSGIAVPVLIGVVIQSVREGAGMVSGVLTTAQQFASAVGVAAVGAVFFAVLGSGHTLADYTRAMPWSASSSLLLANRGGRHQRTADEGQQGAPTGRDPDEGRPPRRPLTTGRPESGLPR
jgi:hypothetical protein